MTDAIDIDELLKGPSIGAPKSGVSHAIDIDELLKGQSVNEMTSQQQEPIQQDFSWPRYLGETAAKTLIRPQFAENMDPHLSYQEREQALHGAPEDAAAAQAVEEAARAGLAPPPEKTFMDAITQRQNMMNPARTAHILNAVAAAPDRAERIQSGLEAQGINLDTQRPTTAFQRGAGKALEFAIEAARNPTSAPLQAAKLGAGMATVSQGLQGMGANPLVADIVGAVGAKTPENVLKTLASPSKMAALPGKIAAIPGKIASIPNKLMKHAATIGAEPNVEALKLAEKHGVDLPLNVGLRSTPLNWMQNVLSKTIMSSKKFKDSMQQSNESMLRAVKKNIDTLGEDVAPSAASQKFRDFILSEEKEANQIARAEYDTARNLLKPTDKVTPTHTAKTIEAMEEFLTRDITSPETQAVAKHVAKLAEAWGISPKGVKAATLADGSSIDPATMKKIVDKIARELPAKPISVQRLAGVRSELGDILKHPVKVLGKEKWLQSLQQSITKDLEASANQEYVAAIKHANKSYATNYASRFKQDIAESILKNDTPLYTYEQLTNTKSLDALNRIAGESPKAKDVVNSLKKAKVREIFHNAFSEDGLKMGNFSRVFDKKETSQEFIKGLLGNESYKNLSEIAKISREYTAAGRDLLNTSSTAYVASDLNKLGRVTDSVKAALIALFAANPAKAIPLIAGGASIVAVPNMVSRLLANPKFVKQARAFAVARKNGNQKYSNQLLPLLGKNASNILSERRKKEESNGND